MRVEGTARGDGKKGQARTTRRVIPTNSRQNGADRTARWASAPYQRPDYR
jgi:hypothetical protein